MLLPSVRLIWLIGLLHRLDGIGSLIVSTAHVKVRRVDIVLLVLVRVGWGLPLVLLQI